MLRSSVAILAGAGLLSTVLTAQSSQPSGNQSSSQQPPPAQVQPSPQQEPQAVPANDQMKSNSPDGKQRPIKIIIEPQKERKPLPTGILDKATPA